MKLLEIHAKEFWYKVTQKAMKNPPEERLGDHTEFENVLVVFTCVEKGDDIETARNAIVAIKNHMDTVKVNTLVLYPYAHLSSELAPISIAFTILKEMEMYAETKGIKVHRAPFGYYKEFNLHAYGHPLAELSKKI